MKVTKMLDKTICILPAGNSRPESYMKLVDGPWRKQSGISYIPRLEIYNCYTLYNSLPGGRRYRGKFPSFLILKGSYLLTGKDVKFSQGVAFVSCSCREKKKKSSKLLIRESSLMENLKWGKGTQALK